MARDSFQRTPGGQGRCPPASTPWDAVPNQKQLCKATLKEGERSLRKPLLSYLKFHLLSAPCGAGSLAFFFSPSCLWVPCMFLVVIIAYSFSLLYGILLYEYVKMYLTILQLMDIWVVVRRWASLVAQLI